MQIQLSTIRKQDLNPKEPFNSFLGLYNRLLLKVVSILNQGILVQDNLSHQIEIKTAISSTIQFLKKYLANLLLSC